MLIGGESKDSAIGAGSSVLDPSNTAVVAEVPRATKQDAKAAIESAKTALHSAGWVDIDPSKRGRLLTKLTTLVRENSEQLARLETLSEGKTLRESKGDVAWAARAFEYWAGLADKVEGETIPVPPKRLNYTLREPLGVTVHIVPWNYPIALAARSLAPAIAAGNTVVMKPSEITPLTAIMLGDLALKAGIPKGVVNIVTGSGAEVGGALVSDSQVDGIVFTGSAETGTQVMESAAKNVTRVLLELGGKNPHIVFPDADLAKAAKSVREGIFTNAGQMCWAGSRAFIHESVYDAFVKDLVAKTRAMKIGRDEIFGPVLGITKFKTLDEVVAMANETNYGLYGGVWTSNLKVAHELAARLQVGGLAVNEYLVTFPQTPFGGYKDSGIGHENGIRSIEFYTRTKNVSINLS